MTGRVTIIAELGSVPDGSVGQALALALACVDAGCDAIKTQDHRWQPIPDDAKHPPWMDWRLVEKRSEYVKRLAWTDEQWLDLAAHVRSDLWAPLDGRGKIQHIVSPFSVEALAWHLDNRTIDGIKIASGQVTNRALLMMARESRLPVYMSHGMTTHEESWEAMELVPGATYMVCTSQYPCSPELSRIGSIPKSYMPTPWGYSDHTLGFAASLAAITLGATVVERHVCWDRRGYGSDAGHSLTVDEFARFCSEVRDLEKMLASPLQKDDIVRTLGATRAAFLYRETNNANGNSDGDVCNGVR